MKMFVKIAHQVNLLHVQRRVTMIEKQFYKYYVFSKPVVALGEFYYTYLTEYGREGRFLSTKVMFFCQENCYDSSQYRHYVCKSCRVKYTRESDFLNSSIIGRAKFQCPYEFCIESKEDFGGILRMSYIHVEKSIKTFL